MRVNLTEAIALLQQGEVVAIPTETVYGLAADATNDAALQKIYATKQRPADHPLIVHVSDITQVTLWAAEFPDNAVTLASTFWPGALTLVLPALPHVSRVVRGGEATVALRVPNHPLTLDVLKQGQLSVAAPSANLFTQLSPTTATHVENGLGATVPVLDGGACQVGIESTIVSVASDGQWELLRPGMISEAAIEAVIGPAQVSLKNQPKPKVPGQHLLHYSPRTPLQLFSERAALLRAASALKISGQQRAALLIGEGELPDCQVIILPALPETVAEQLYGALHQLDGLKVDTLLVEMPPDTPAWAAVRDRLSRAGYQPE